MPVLINQNGNVLATEVATQPDATSGNELVLLPDTDVHSVAVLIGDLERVYLPFASHTDGRGLSQARLLRGRYAFTGRLCATGALTPDLLPLLKRCGVDEFIVDTAISETAGALLNDSMPSYQPSADGSASIGLPGARSAAVEQHP